MEKMDEGYFLKNKGRKIRFLYVDDDEKFLSLFARRFESVEDIKVRVCDEPSEVIDLLENSSFDCVVSDYNMNGLNGLDLLDIVREKHPDMPFILLTGAGDEKTASEAISREVTGYITKENWLKKSGILEEKIRNAVNAKRLQNQARKLLERVNDGFFALDRDWRFTYLNNAAEQFLNREREELLGKKVWNEFPEAAESVFEHKYRRAIEAQENVHFESYYPPLDKWFSVKAYPSETGLSVYFRDISARKEREKQLRSQVERQTAITDLLRFALEEEDLVELQQKAAEKVSGILGSDYCKILKLEKDELILAATHGIDLSEIGKSALPVEDSFQSGHTAKYGESIMVDDYETSRFERTDLLNFLKVESGISVIIGEIEHPWGILSTYSRKPRNFSETDIEFVEAIASIIATAIERQRQGRTLREYKKAMNAVNDAVYLIDGKSRFLLVNEEFEKLTGYTREELKGKKIDDLNAENISGNKSILEIKNSDGEKLKLETHVSSVTLPDGSEGEMAVLRKPSKEQ